MKVLNLRCANGHGFEGWFGSDDDFLGQNGRGLIECPLCGDRIIARMPSAPRLNLSGATEPKLAKPATPVQPEPAAVEAEPDSRQELQSAWLRVVSHVLRHTEDVGERFAEEARRIHYGEVPHRGIRGRASADERAALADEGIEVMPLPLPAGLDGPAH